MRIFAFGHLPAQRESDRARGRGLLCLWLGDETRLQFAPA